MSASTFMSNLLKMRIYTAQKGLCRKNPSLIMAYALKAQQWMATWKPSDSQCLAYIRRHMTEIEYLLPGDGPAANTWRQRLEDLLHAS